MDNIELAIQEALQPIPERAEKEGWVDENPRWTKAVKEAIVEVGKKNEWYTAANQCETDAGMEWLYDVVWWKYDDKSYMTDVPLVAECEWGNENQIKWDFEKLLVSRSRYRLMVFQGGSEELVRRLFDKMRQWIENFHATTAGDRYLFAGLSVSPKNQFFFDLHVVE